MGKTGVSHVEEHGELAFISVPSGLDPEGLAVPVASFVEPQDS